MSVQICPYKDAACCEFPESARCADCPTTLKGRLEAAELAECKAKLTALEIPPPPQECQTEGEKKAFAFGWWKAMEAKNAELAALEGQKPVAWWIPKAEQFCLSSKDGSRPFAKAWEPLFPAAGARE